MTGREVRRLRERLGLTQQDFASLLGLSFVSINRWEQGHSSPTGLSDVLLQLLASVLAQYDEADVVSLLRRTGPVPLDLIRTLVRLEEGRDR